MRRINEKTYEVWTTGSGTDDYGQRVPITFSDRTIRANVAMQSQVVFEEQASFTVSYYTGLTDDRDLEVGQELRDGNIKLKITSVNNDARRTQLVLEAI